MKDIPGGRGFKPKREGSADILGANSEIGRKLKEYYNDLVSTDVPDRFADLLSRLEQTEKADQPSDKKD
ncbi:MAG TPA: NepR family anti-sigma factor [Rhizobiaceae bacterium]|nr:NepR family anti-sigma factor [Rhizobiaceae bacterium]